MLESLKHEDLQFQELSPEEKQARGILARLTGPIASFTKGTRNGRKYSDKLWEKAFDSPLVKEMFKNGGLPGELQHPENRSETDPTKIAIMMPEPPKKDNNGHLVASVDILDTPCGQIAYQLGKYGFKFGISSRGEGDLIQDFSGEESVDPDTYTLNAFDLVLIPACEDARLQFNESLNTKSNNKLRTILSEALNNASDTDRKIMEEALDELNIDDNWRYIETYKDEDIYYDPDSKKYIVGELDNQTVLNSLKNAKQYIDRFTSETLTEEQVGREETKSSESASDILKDKPQNNKESKEQSATKVSVNINDNTEDKDVEVESEDDILEEALTPQEKMDAWAAGNRRENIKACGDVKLYKYLDICRNSGYSEQAEIIVDELENRGLPVPDDGSKSTIRPSSNKKSVSNQPLKPTAKVHNGEIYLCKDNAGISLISKYLDPRAVDLELVGNKEYFIIHRDDSYANSLAAELMSLLKGSQVTEALHEFYTNINEDSYDGIEDRASWDTDFHRLDVAYNHNFKQYKDMEADSGIIRDFTDDLEAQGKEYDIYKHKSDPGCTIFFQESLNESIYKGFKIAKNDKGAYSVYDAEGIELYDNLKNRSSAKTAIDREVDTWGDDAFGGRKIFDKSLTEDISWDDLNGTEQSAVEAALVEISNGSTVEDAVHGAIAMYNEENTNSDYEDEDFYMEEADYTKVLDYVTSHTQDIYQEPDSLEEAFGKDYSDIPEIKSINYRNNKSNMLPGISNMKAFIQALEEVGEPIFKIRSSRFPLSHGDIKDEWVDIKRNGWSVGKTWDSSLSGFNEVYICKKLNEELNEDKYTRDELFDKFGTDNLDIINAGNEETVELADDNDVAIVEQLQKILKQNKSLEEKVKSLQEKISVGYAKEMELKEELDTYKQKVSKLSKRTKEIKVLTEKLSKAEKILKDNKLQAEGKISTLNESIQSKGSENKDLKKNISDLNEAVDRKNSKIRSLNEQIAEYKDQLSSKDNDIEKLKEQYETGQKDLEQVRENYSKKLEQQNQIIEKYRRVAKNSVKRYVESQAIRLGVKSDEIVNRLPKNYSFNDIDKICEDLQEYKFNMSNLPFNSQLLNENVKINAKNINNGLIEADPDDEITDYDLKVAEAFL